MRWYKRGMLSRVLEEHPFAANIPSKMFSGFINANFLLLSLLVPFATAAPKHSKSSKSSDVTQLSDGTSLQVCVLGK